MVSSLRFVHPSMCVGLSTLLQHKCDLQKIIETLKLKQTWGQEADLNMQADRIQAWGQEADPNTQASRIQASGRQAEPNTELKLRMQTQTHRHPGFRLGTSRIQAWGREADPNTQAFICGIWDLLQNCRGLGPGICWNCWCVACMRYFELAPKLSWTAVWYFL